MTNPLIHPITVEISTIKLDITFSIPRMLIIEWINLNLKELTNWHFRVGMCLDDDGTFQTGMWYLLDKDGTPIYQMDSNMSPTYFEYATFSDILLPVMDHYLE